ncbi:MAG: hypothetical protein ACJ76I_15685 [Gaiellaceae bacterium]
MLVARHPVSVLIVAAALAIAAAVFVFARPQYRPEVTVRNYDMSTRARYTVREVREAFAAHGIDLRYSRLLPGDRGAWVRNLSAVPAIESDTSHVNVSVFGPRTKLGWGITHERLETITGNVAVTYDGGNDDVLRRAKAAVADLR